MAARIARELIVGGIFYWRWGDDILVVAGWIIGWLLADLDDIFYVMVCNPQELTCQRVKGLLAGKNYKEAWKLLRETRGERNQLPVRNVLTGTIVMILGIWIVTSNGSALGSGVVLGLGVRLLAELLAERDWKKWYWIFAREFSQSEYSLTVMGWAAALVWEILMTVRG